MSPKSSAAVFKKGPGIARYVIKGDGIHFLRQISFYRGLRLTLEKAMLKYILKTKQINSGEIQSALLKVQYFLDAAADDWTGCFLYTAWYKDTIIVGCAEKNSRRFFFKLFKHAKSADIECRRMVQLKELYGKWFEIPDIIECSEGLLVSSFIQRHASASRETVCCLLAQAAKEWHHNNNSQSASLGHLIEKIKKSIKNIHASKLPVFDFQHFFETVYNKLYPSWTSYPVQPAHGDMTAWNMYTTPSGSIALVDPERMELRSRYTDLAHFLVQQKAMQRFETKSPFVFIDHLCRWTGITPGESKIWNSLYLLEELCNDAQQLNIKNDQKIFIRTFKRRLEWLDYIIGSI